MQAVTVLPLPLDAGWATGGQRTVKWNITSGTVQKGQSFILVFRTLLRTGKLTVQRIKNTFPASTNWYSKVYNSATNATNPGDGGLVHPSSFANSALLPTVENSCGQPY